MKSRHKKLALIGGALAILGIIAALVLMLAVILWRA